MIAAEKFLACLEHSGVGYFSGVPDSLLKSLCACLEHRIAPERHTIAANEGSAVGLAVGYHLATGRVPAIYLQNSGQGNALNPLVSLADPEVYGIPVLIIVGWRGEPGIPDEPQHIKQGAITLPLFEALGIPYSLLDGNESDLAGLVSDAVASAEARGGPHAIVVSKGTFLPYEYDPEGPLSLGWSREDAINVIVDYLAADDVVVATTGMASRELYEIRNNRGQGNERDFLTVGGMGHASQIALGIANTATDRRVVCIDGDGAVLMHMGALAIIGTAAGDNLLHIVINNGAHDSVGGQPTACRTIDLPGIAQACGYAWTGRCDGPGDAEQLLAEIFSAQGPALLELRVDAGHRNNLSRPTAHPAESKARFSEFLRT